MAKIKNWEEQDIKEFQWNKFNKADKIIKVFKNTRTQIYIFVNRNDLMSVTWSVGISSSKRFEQATSLAMRNKRKDAYIIMESYMRSHYNG